MEVILKEDVAKLGSRGDVVKVAEGYGRNYLLPRKLAIEATKSNRAVIEQMKSAAQRRSVRDQADAEGLAQQMQELTLTFRRKVGEQDHLFGSVTSGDVAEALEAKGFTVDRRKVHLDDPIKALGEFQVAIRLHKQVTASVKVMVEKEAQKEE
jgi:large subunit ribosomal protein L9